jgi:hypothetical protein
MINKAATQTGGPEMNTTLIPAADITYMTEYDAANDDYDATVTQLRARRDSEFAHLLPADRTSINQIGLDAMVPEIETLVEQAGVERITRIAAARATRNQALPA